MGPRSTSGRPELAGSAALEHIRSNEIGTAESMLAQVGRDGDEVRDEEKSKSGEDAREDDQPPSDSDYPEGGCKAWSVVFGVFALVCCQMGYGLIWGVLSQKLHETTHKEVPLSILNLSVGLCNFTMNGSSFVSGRLGDRYWYKRMIAFGIVATFISLLISSFVGASLPLLFVFQGFFLGLSQGLGYPLFLSLPSQWFLRKRGLATGIAASGAGFGGAISSLVIRGLLPRLGYNRTLLVYACLNLTISVGAWFLLEVREIPSARGLPKVARTWLPVGIWGDGAFYSLMGAIFVGIFGYLTPYYFLTTYTTVKCPDLDPSSITPALPLVAANLLSGTGRVFAGFLADLIGPINAMFLSFFLGGLFQLSIWPVANSYGTIMTFACLYGFVGAWFLSLLPVACAQLFGMRGLSTITGFGILANSPGQFLGATIAGVVLTRSGGYRGVAFHAGGMMMAGSICLLWARFSRVPSLLRKF